jgi:hypothetical protein
MVPSAADCAQQNDAVCSFFHGDFQSELCIRFIFVAGKSPDFDTFVHVFLQQGRIC